MKVTKRKLSYTPSILACHNLPGPYGIDHKIGKKIGLSHQDHLLVAGSILNLSNYNCRDRFLAIQPRDSNLRP